LQDEIDRSLQELNKLESDLSNARTAYRTIHPAGFAYKTSLEVRAAFSSDPRSAAQSLAGWIQSHALGAFGLAALVLIMLLFFLGSLEWTVTASTSCPDSQPHFYRHPHSHRYLHTDLHATATLPSHHRTFTLPPPPSTALHCATSGPARLL